MPTDAGNGEQRWRDKFGLLAKEQGYRSRAAFKLLQLDTRFRFLPTARAVLDLCAAPGGWVQVAVSRATPGAFVVGVDLLPIRPIDGALALKEDITAGARCGAAVRRLMESRGVESFEVVLHDGNLSASGGTSASAAQDSTTTQSALVMDAVRLATMFLAPNGTFITKFFRCQDYEAVMFCLKQLFERVHLKKPVASRSTPAEIYVICLRYKAPAKVEPELLDLKHLRLLTVDHEKSKRPESTEFCKTGLASDFIWSEAHTPLEFLGSFWTISFDDPASLPIKNHELTTNLIKEFCEHLYVLDEDCYDYLLKWRMRIKKALSSCSQGTQADGAATAGKGRDDNQLVHEVEDLKNVVARKRKRMKRQSRPHAKGKAHKVSGMQMNATEYGYVDPDWCPNCTIEVSFQGVATG